jgi:hypothetical protein
MHLVRNPPGAGRSHLSRREHNVSDHWLESVSWLAQIGVLLVALGAAYFGFQQLRSYKIFEMIKYIEDEEFRTLRRIVIMDIPLLNYKHWWGGHDEHTKTLEKAAAAVCTRYDILGLMIESDTLDKGFGDFFTKNWADSIIHSHNVLQGYLDHRRNAAAHQDRKTVTDAYKHFTRLRDAAVLATSSKATAQTAHTNKWHVSIAVAAVILYALYLFLYDRRLSIASLPPTFLYMIMFGALLSVCLAFIELIGWVRHK